jgi:hypothetical protein
MLLDVLAIAEETGSSAYLGAGAREGTAGLVALLEDWERSARLYGATEVPVQQTGYRREPVDARFLAPLIARARDAMGDAKFAAARHAAFRTQQRKATELRSVRTYLAEGEDLLRSVRMETAPATPDGALRPTTQSGGVTASAS